MIQFLRNNLVAIAGSALLLLGGYAYWVYIGQNSGTPLQSTDASAVSQDLLGLLSSLGTIKLDDSVFSDASFKSLSDFGVVIPPQSVGRPNPFLPLSGTVVQP